MRASVAVKRLQLYRNVCRPASVRLTLFAMALLAASPLLAQNAELSGFVSDPSSLAVANARVVVQSAGNGATRTVVFKPARRVQRSSVAAWSL